MGYQDLKNSIDQYNSKAHEYRILLQEFDFQGFLRNSAQIDALITHHAFAQTKPLSMTEVKDVASYNGMSKLFSAHITHCFSDKYPIKALEDFLEIYKSIPDKYKQFLALNLSKEELYICEKVLDNFTLYSLHGKETLLQFKEEYMSDLLAKSLPCLSENDIQNLIGTGVLTEKRMLDYKQKGYFNQAGDMSHIYEALGMPVETSITFNGIKAVGTTYKTNATNTPRQELLSELDKRSREGERDALQLIPYIFTKDNISCNAVMLRWGKEDIANLSQPFVDNAFEKFENPTFTVLDYEVLGGYSATASFGIKLNIKISGYEKNKAQTEITEVQSLRAENPLNI